jgi:hypothetical protein
VLPTAVASLSSGATGISAGDYHSCASLADGTARCWGENIYGQVGDGTTTNRLSPVLPAGLGAAVSVTSGGRHACALWLGGLKCWGSNSYGQLGDGTTTVRLSPVDAASVAYAPCSDVTANCASGSSRLVNLSARSPVLLNAEVLIGGFVVGGALPKKVLVTARGPSLAAYGITGVIANPRIDLYAGQTRIASNDDWQVDNPGATEIAALGTFPKGLAPSSALESAVLVTLNPGAYTAVVSGADGTTGIGIVEVFELDRPESPLANLSTRSAVLGGSGVMIGGFVVSGNVPRTVLVTARGPSLSAYGIANPLPNPKLEIYSGQTRIAINDDYGSSPNLAQILATGVAPAHPLEAAVLVTLPPGPYTAIVSGAAGTAGVAIVEVFAR